MGISLRKVKVVFERKCGLLIVNNESSINIVSTGVLKESLSNDEELSCRIGGNECQVWMKQ